MSPQVLAIITYAAIAANLFLSAFVSAVPAGHDLPWWVMPLALAFNALVHALPSDGLPMPSKNVAKAALILSMLALGGVSLSACKTETISANPNPLPAIVSALPASSITANDLKTAAANFDAANSIGIPGMADWSACQHVINEQLGVEPTPGAPTYPSVTLTNNGLVSGASEIIINAAIAQQLLNTGLNIPQNCVTAVGMLNLNAMAAAIKALPGGGSIKINVTPALTAAQIQAIIQANAPAVPAATTAPGAATPATK